ncbi:MAG: hypothetical protein O7H39_13610 [Gammaproteobacteria bacterium]|nr:hypothetical protein [Gammaproteobacteria bacterium]
MSQSITPESLHLENLAFAGTRGISENARPQRFVPAFCDSETGRIEIARFASGKPAPWHVIEGMPDEWAAEHNGMGEICALKSTIVAGFVRDGEFFTREQAAGLIA